MIEAEINESEIDVHHQDENLDNIVPMGGTPTRNIMNKPSPVRMASIPAEMPADPAPLPPPPYLSESNSPLKPTAINHIASSSQNEEEFVTAASHATSDPISIGPRKEASDFFNKDIYFWNINECSYMGRGLTNPTMVKDCGKNNKFRIIPVKVTANRIQVGIQSVESGDFLSCRRKANISIPGVMMSMVPSNNTDQKSEYRHQFALAEYRRELLEFETFDMIPTTVPSSTQDNGCVGGSSFVFQSHNDLFLAVNETFKTCEFKTCKGQDGFGIPIKGRWELLVCDSIATGGDDTNATDVHKGEERESNVPLSAPVGEIDTASNIIGKVPLVGKKIQKYFRKE